MRPVTHVAYTDGRVEVAIALAEGALLGTEPKRDLWTDADYLCAILAALTGDGHRARRAAVAEHARRLEP